MHEEKGGRGEAGCLREGAEGKEDIEGRRGDVICEGGKKDQIGK